MTELKDILQSMNDTEDTLVEVMLGKAIQFLAGTVPAHIIVRTLLKFGLTLACFVDHPTVGKAPAKDAGFEAALDHGTEVLQVLMNECQVPVIVALTDHFAVKH